MEEVFIIGCGLSGLTTIYELEKKNIGIKIFEIQNRLGRRLEYWHLEEWMELG